MEEWDTPLFLKIKEKRTKRISPYLESELWEKDDILLITKYEPYKRNKATMKRVLYIHLNCSEKLATNFFLTIKCMQSSGMITISYIGVRMFSPSSNSIHNEHYSNKG